MNIFEKYGGYEAVKQAAMNYKNSGDMVTAAGLELQCLEYRRQYNIYEFGDLVFDLSDDDKKYTGQILKVGEIGPDFLVCYDDQGKRFCVIIHDAVHATDAEIQAGKRL